MPLFSRAFRDGANRDRTGDLLLAKQALSQLSYGPKCLKFNARSRSCPSRPVVPSAGSAVEVEVLRRALLEPEPVVLRRVLQELRCLLEHVLVLAGGIGLGLG